MRNRAAHVQNREKGHENALAFPLVLHAGFPSSGRVVLDFS